MRPVLHPSLSCAWRDATTLQVGVTPGRALVLAGLGQAEVAVLRAMDGRTTLVTLRNLAVAAGGHAEDADRMVDLLLGAGAAVDLEQLGSPDRQHTHHAPDRSSLGLVRRDSDGGHAAFGERGRRHVEVVGAGRVGATVTRLLAAGGVGDIDVDDDELVSVGDVSPAGHPAGAVGLARTRSLHSHLGPGPGTRTIENAEPDFVVLAPAGTFAHSWLTDSLIRSGTPHLLAHVVEVTGVVGPLVVPGTTACLRCLDLYRTDRDGGWPTVLDQTTRKPPKSPACDSSLATTVGGLAAAQVLAFLDGFDVATVGGSLELELPYGLPRRRSWQPHPECGCTWPDTAEWRCERPPA